eukprot:gene2545-4964_t
MSICNSCKEDLIEAGLLVTQNCPIEGCGFPVERHPIRQIQDWPKEFSVTTISISAVTISFVDRLNTRLKLPIMEKDFLPDLTKDLNIFDPFDWAGQSKDSYGNIGCIRGGSDVVIVPRNASRHFLLYQICVLFELRTNSFEDGIPQAVLELVCARCLSFQPQVMVVLTDLCTDMAMVVSEVLSTTAVPRGDYQAREDLNDPREEGVKSFKRIKLSSSEVLEQHLEMLQDAENIQERAQITASMLRAFYMGESTYAKVRYHRTCISNILILYNGTHLFDFSTTSLKSMQQPNVENNPLESRKCPFAYNERNVKLGSTTLSLRKSYCLYSTKHLQLHNLSVKMQQEERLI